MMEELREIRDELSKLIEPMTGEERIRFYHDRTEAVAASMGRELRPHPTIPNAQIMVPVEVGP